MDTNVILGLKHAAQPHLAKMPSGHAMKGRNAALAYARVLKFLKVLSTCAAMNARMVSLNAAMRMEILTMKLFHPQTAPYYAMIQDARSAVMLMETVPKAMSTA